MTATGMTLLCTALAVVGDPPPECRYGYLNQPAYSIDRCLRPPLTPYRPQPGDIILYSDANFVWSTLYFLGGTGAPGHSGLVVRLPGGELGVLEAGLNDKPWVRLVPLAERLRSYGGTAWVRRRCCPVAPEQALALTEFAAAIDGRRYGVLRLLSQLTPLRSRGPLRTIFLGKPRGLRDSYICSEAVLEALVYAGLLDAATTRPSATYPRDLFFDRSLNPYINRHLRLDRAWEPPALWRAGP
jgi:hypothetical protein